MTMRRALCALTLMGFAAAAAQAGELDGYTGRLKYNDDDPGTYTWGIEYREPLTDHWSASFVWLNEGHKPHDHRDGQAMQIWWHTGPELSGFVFDAGIGPYRYYDTRLLSSDPDFLNRHGWGALGSTSLNYYFSNNWFTFLRVNEVLTTLHYDSTSLSVGAGYRFSLDWIPHDASPSTGAWAADIMVGERIGNTAHSEAGGAEVVDVRRQLSEHFTVSASFISGQGPLLNWRDGLAAQLWLEQRLTSRFTVGVGAGVFVVSSDDELKDASSPSNLAAMVSVELAYAFTHKWETRVVWDRVGTGDDHDCDIVLAGVGYKF